MEDCQALLFALLCGVMCIKLSQAQEVILTMKKDSTSACHEIVDTHGIIRSHSGIPSTNFETFTNYGFCLKTASGAEMIKLTFQTLNLGDRTIPQGGCEDTNAAASNENRFYIYNGYYDDGNPRMVFHCGGGRIEETYTWGPFELASPYIIFNLTTAKNGNEGIFAEYVVLNCAEAREIYPDYICAERTTTQSTATVPLLTDVTDNNTAPDIKQNSSDTCKCPGTKVQCPDEGIPTSKLNLGLLVGNIVQFIVIVLSWMGFVVITFRHKVGETFKNCWNKPLRARSIVPYQPVGEHDIIPYQPSDAEEALQQFIDANNVTDMQNDRKSKRANKETAV